MEMKMLSVKKFDEKTPSVAFEEMVIQKNLEFVKLNGSGMMMLQKFYGID